MPTHPGPDVQGAAVVTLQGECDAFDEPVLAALLRERIAARRPIIVDFSHATFVDSIVLGSLLAILREAEHAGVGLVLYLPDRAGDEIHRVFSISGLDRILPLRRSWREAAAAVTGGGAPAPGPGDEAELLAAFDALYAAATQSRDAAAAMRVFAEDDDITMWGSDEPEQAVGATAVRELAESIVASPSSLAFRWSSRRVHVESDAAWVNAIGEFALEAADGSERMTPYRVTAVFVRREGRWLWHTHSGSEPNLV